MIKISPTPFDPWREVQAYQSATPQLNGQYGATALFIGTLRDFNLGDEITSMTLEYYPGMTEKMLTRIVTDAKQHWAILESLIIHRVGNITPNQPIVLVAVWTAHRGDAFDACRNIMEKLKNDAPFWKKEHLKSNQSRWLESNSTGYQSL